MPDPVTTSPARDRAAIDGGISMVELPWCGKLILRGDPENSQFTDAAASALGVALPLEANTNRNRDTVTLYWLGPDEWLCHCPLDGKGKLQSALIAGFAGVHSAVVDVSDYYTVLNLEGDRSHEVLARGCPLDLHPKSFPAGSSTQTRFGQASILLHKTGDAEFLIQVRWSFTEYAWDYIASAIKAI